MEDDKVNLSTWGEGKQQQQTKRNTLTKSAKKKNQNITFWNASMQDKIYRDFI